MADNIESSSKKQKQETIKADTGKRRKEQFIEQLNEGDKVNDFFAIKMKSPPRPYKRGTWFNILSSDKTGEISIKYWGGENKEQVKKLYESLQIGDVIKVRNGVYEIYADKPQISINEDKGSMTKLVPGEYDVKDFLPTLENEKIDKLTKKLIDEIENMEDKQLKNLLNSFFKDQKFLQEFIHAPSAMTHHHNYIGGNLEHTSNVVELCKKITTMYHHINKDLLITGAILHDVGKIKEYKTTASIDKTSEGNFIGHIVIGDRWIKEKIQKIREKGGTFSDEKEIHLSHMILSHHGKYEYGSPRMPKTIEACILHQADNMDAQVKNFIQHIKEGRKMTDEKWAFLYDSEVGRKRNMYLGKDY
ncbi:MAG: HD domain-containing protein [Candidatus Thermoplasmatota archaeon]